MSCSHLVRVASSVACGPALAIITLSSAALTRVPSGSIASRARSSRITKSSIDFIVASLTSPP